MSTIQALVRINTHRVNNVTHLMKIYITTDQSLQEHPDRTMEVTIRTDKQGGAVPIVITISDNGQKATITFAGKDAEAVEFERIESDDPCELVFITFLHDSPKH